MKACMVENGMHFDEKEVSDLATALFEDAVQVSIIFNANIPLVVNMIHNTKLPAQPSTRKIFLYRAPADIFIIFPCRRPKVKINFYS